MPANCTLEHARQRAATLTPRATSGRELFKMHTNGASCHVGYIPVGGVTSHSGVRPHLVIYWSQTLFHIIRPAHLQRCHFCPHFSPFQFSHLCLLIPSISLSFFHITLNQSSFSPSCLTPGNRVSLIRQQ